MHAGPLERPHAVLLSLPSCDPFWPIAADVVLAARSQKPKYRASQSGELTFSTLRLLADVVR